jgi:hypothetical protein
LIDDPEVVEEERRLGTFTSEKPGKSEIVCRDGMMIQTPQGVSYEKYVETAFRAELLVAGVERPPRRSRSPATWNGCTGVT